MSVVYGTLPFETIMCKSSPSKYRIDNTKNGVSFPLFTSEAKGVENSEFSCMIPALQIAADSAIYLNRKTKIPIENCSIPGIIVFSNKVLFYGVYLVEGHFPVITLLSRALSYANFNDREMIVKYILACADFIADSQKLIGSTTIQSDLGAIYFV